MKFNVQNSILKAVILTVLLAAGFDLQIKAQSVTFTVSKTDPVCNGGTGGKILVTPSNGTSPYTYSKDGGSTYQVANQFLGLKAGVYAVRVKDTKGAESAVQQITLNEPAVLTFTTEKKDVVCGKASDGSITFTATGGTPPYRYSIDNGITYKTTNVFSNLPGTGTGYYPKIMDSKNCVAWKPAIFIMSPTPVQIAAVSTKDVSCYNAKDGSITITANGGTHTYTYSIDGGNTFNTGNVIQGLAPGNYTVQAKDNRGCLSGLKSVMIVQPPQLSAKITDCKTTIYGYGNNNCTSLEVSNVSGGNPPYAYKWGAGGNSSVTSVCPQATQSYTCEVSDNKGCKLSLNAKVHVNDVTCERGNSGNKQDICIDESGVPAHINSEPGHQGCYLGKCDYKNPCSGSPW